MGDDHQRATVLDRPGDACVTLIKYTDAEESYHLAQSLFSSLRDRRGEARELRSLAPLHGAQGRHHDAEEQVAQARSASADVADDDGDAMALDGLMVTCGYQERFAEMRSYFMAACEMYNRTGKPVSEICTEFLGLLQDE